MSKIIELIYSAFKDEKSRLMFVCAISLTYILWNEWRMETTLNKEFVLEQLRECKETNRRCEVKLDQFTHFMQGRIDEANQKIKELEKTIEWSQRQRLQ